MTRFWIFHQSGSIFISFMVPLTGPWSQCVLLASFWQFHPPGIFSFPSIVCSKGSSLYWMMLTFPWIIHPPGITSYFFIDTFIYPSSMQILSSLPSFIIGSGAGDSYFFPFTGTWTYALTVHFPTMPSRQVSPPSQPLQSVRLQCNNIFSFFFVALKPSWNFVHATYHNVTVRGVLTSFRIFQRNSTILSV